MGYEVEHLCREIDRESLTGTDMAAKVFDWIANHYLCDSGDYPLQQAASVASKRIREAHAL